MFVEFFVLKVEEESDVTNEGGKEIEGHERRDFER